LLGLALQDQPLATELGEGLVRPTGRAALRAAGGTGAVPTRRRKADCHTPLDLICHVDKAVSGFPAVPLSSPGQAGQ
jgi:hypothetical protein